MTMTKINLILLGDSGVGKTSLVKRFKTGSFKDSVQETFVDVVRKTIEVKGLEVQVVVWDTAGQEIYYALIRKYFAVADGAVLMYDVNRPATFATLTKWMADLRAANETAEVLIVGNKNEDPVEKRVEFDDAQNFAGSIDLDCMEASGKTGLNVEEIFNRLTEKVLVAKGLLLADECEGPSQTPPGNNQEKEISFSYFNQPTAGRKSAAITSNGSESINDEVLLNAPNSSTEPSNSGWCMCG